MTTSMIPATPATDAIAITDDAILAALGGMTRTDDTGDGVGASVPVLKISSDPDAGLNPGEWVVGQKKGEDGTIIDQGKRVVGLVILVVRNRFSYYNQRDTKLNCSSPVYLHNDPNFVVGSNLKIPCGKSCPNRAEGLNPRCQAQKVVYGLALTAEGEFVDCICYIKGTGYMPLSDYVKTKFTARTKGGIQELPLFTFLTRLSSTRQKNAGTTYYVPGFERGELFDLANLQRFAKKRDEVLTYIEAMNNARAAKMAESAGMTAGTGAAPVAPRPMPTAAPAAPRPMPTASATVPPTYDVGAVTSPFEGMDPMPGDPVLSAKPVSATAMPTTAPEVSDDDVDIEAAIAKALGKA